MSESQETQILRWLAQGYTITPLEALERFNCLALSQRIGRLKRRGWPIVTNMIKTKTNKVVACYEIPQARQTPIVIEDTV